jgi:hypothetical protein
MTLKSLMIVALALLILPSVAMADASIRQDACETWVENGTTFARIHFTAINFSLPGPLCDLHFIPEPQPVRPECEMIEAVPAEGWSAFLNPFGGADWFANTPDDCIAPGTAKDGFSFLLDPGFCCYVVQFTDATGAVVLEQEECFCEKPVQTKNATWGQVKSIYR